MTWSRACKCVDLLPYPGRHGPSWDEDDGAAAAGFEVMDARAVGGLEEIALCGRRLGEDAGRQDAEQNTANMRS